MQQLQQLNKINNNTSDDNKENLDSTSILMPIINIDGSGENLEDVQNSINKIFNKNNLNDKKLQYTKDYKSSFDNSCIVRSLIYYLFPNCKFTFENCNISIFFNKDPEDLLKVLISSYMTIDTNMYNTLQLISNIYQQRNILDLNSLEKQLNNIYINFMSYKFGSRRKCITTIRKRRSKKRSKKRSNIK